MSAEPDSLSAPHRYADRAGPVASLALAALDVAGNGTLVIRVRQERCAIEYASSAFEQLAGRERRELLGRRPDFMQSMDGLWDLAQLLERHELPEGARAEVRGQRTDGAPFRALLQLQLLPSDTECCVLSFTAVPAAAAVDSAAIGREADARLRAVTDHMPDGLAILSVDGRVQWQSSSSLGYLPESRIGASIFEHVHVDDLQAARGKFLGLIADARNEHLHDMELRVRDVDGSWRWMHMTGANLLSHPAVRGLVISSRDVTAQRVAAAALRDSEARYRIIADMTPGFIYEAELRNGTPFMTWAGPGLERIHECTLQEYQQRTIESRLHPDDLPAVARHCAALERGEQICEEMRIFTPSRRMKWLRINVRRLDETLPGEVVRLIGTVEEVTEPHRIARLRAETESVARVGSWEFDCDMRQLHWSPEAYRIYETTPTLYAPSVETMFELYAPESVPRAKEFFDRALQFGEPWDADVEFVTLRNRRIWVRTSGRVEFADGRPIRLYGAFQDIDVLKRNEIELRQQRRWLRLALDSAKLVAWRWIAATNEMVVEYRGVGMPMIAPRTSAAGEPLDYLHADSRAAVQQLAAAAMSTGVPMDTEMRVLDSRGLERWVATRAARYHDSAGRVVGLIGTTQDVTEKRLAESALHTQAHVMLTMLEGVAVVDGQGRISLTNPAFDLMFDHPGGTLIGTQFRALFTDVDGAALDPRESGTPTVGRSFEFVGQRRSGTTFTAAAVVSSFMIKDEVCDVYVVQDITERKQLERELIEISSREQERIGSDLHDGLGQELTGIALMLRGLSSRMQRGTTAAAADIEEILGLVNQAIDSARSLARGLSPVSVERGGLVYALRALATRATDLYGVDVRFRSRVSSELRIDGTTATHLYRIAQESSTNAARHGRAERVTVQLTVLARHVRLVITDDGIGIATDAAQSGGMGLKIMRYRAQMIGGKFSIEAGSRGGTRIVCTVAQPAEPRQVRARPARARRSQ